MKLFLNVFMIVAAAVVVQSSVVIAENPPEIRVVHMQDILENSIVGKAARSNLEKELKTGQAKLEGDKIQLKKLKTELQSQGMLLSKDAVEKKQDKIRELEREFQRKANDLQNDMKRKTARTIEQIVVEVNKILAEMADDEGYDFILENDKRFVVFADDSIDITGDVVDLLDDKKLDL